MVENVNKDAMIRASKLLQTQGKHEPFFKIWNKSEFFREKRS